MFMSFYIFLYISVAIVLFYSWYIYNRVYKNLSSLFFFFSLSVFSLWITTYLLSFSTSNNPSILLYLSRFMFTASILGLYYFLAFLLFINWKGKSHQKKNILIKIVSISMILIIIGIFSPFIISEMLFDQIRGIHYESYGILYSIFVILYFSFFPIFLFLSFRKVTKIRKIEKIRMKYICYGFSIFVFLGIVLQVILPLLWIFILERELVLTLLPFILCFWYIHNRFYFTDISVSIGKIFIFIFSLLLSFFVIFLLHEHIQRLPSIYHSFWNISSNPYIFEFCIWVIIHSLTYKILLRYMLPHSQGGVIVDWLMSLREQIPRITSQKALNKYLSDFFQLNFHISHIKVRVIWKWLSDDELFHYFSSWILRDFFINDAFFIENNKNKFKDYKKLGDIWKKIHLVLPWYSRSWEVRLLLELGQKILWDPYWRDEISALKSFVNFLGWHLKYIEVYKEIQDLSINLDRRVDEKTIEFNNLLNKQKEFIAYVGHEIKNPITNTLFLTDWIKEDVQWKVGKDTQEDVSILYDELVKISKLVKYIFSAEKFDLDKVKLYKEPVNISEFLESEIHNFRHNYPYVNFIWDIKNNVMLDIDETQFRQVIQNLVNNSIKFIDRKKPKILVNLYVKRDVVYISIEDNGEGFKNGENENIFSKYVTWSWSSTGLWMGLYLCKKIVELHKGSIHASNSKKLEWACFTIKL